MYVAVLLPLLGRLLGDTVGLAWLGAEAKALLAARVFTPPVLVSRFTTAGCELSSEVCG